jgi:hypothetical protein
VRFDDYVLRAIEQLSQAIASILCALKAGSVDEAEAQLASAYEALLASDQVFLGMVDSATLANLLGSPEKVRILAKLSLLEARAVEARGENPRAAQLRSRARELAQLAQRDDPRVGGESILDDVQ